MFQQKSLQKMQASQIEAPNLQSPSELQIKIVIQLLNLNNRLEQYQQVMSNNQYVSVVIFDLAKETTKEKPHTYKSFEMKRPRLSLPVFWSHLIESLGIDAYTETQAAKLVWKLSNQNFKITNNLLYKLGAVCLMIAQKLYDDQTNSLESFSLVSGVSMKQLRQIELEIVLLLDFNLNLTKEQNERIPQCLAKFQSEPY